MVLWSGLTKRFTQILPVRNDQCHVFLPPRPDHYHLTHELALFQQTLNQLRRDILPIRKLEQIFLPIRDVEMPVFRDISDVARVKPTVLEHSSRRLRLPVITAHHIWTTHENLAVFGDLELDALERNSHRPNVIIPRPVCRDNARLRRTITLQDRYARREIRVRQRWRERRTARDEVSEAPPNP